MNAEKQHFDIEQPNTIFFMNRWTALWLLFLYFLTFSGSIITVHYCDGSVASVRVNEVYKNKACNKNKHCLMKQKPCCENRQTVLKISGKHEAATQTFTFQKSNVWVDKLPLEKQNVYEVKLHISTSKINEANLSPPIPLYNMQCVYRI